MKNITQSLLLFTFLAFSCNQGPEIIVAHPDSMPDELSIEDALLEARAFKAQYPDKSVEISLTPGDYYLSEPIILGPEMSGLSITGPEEGEARIKGSVRKEIKWIVEDDLYVVHLPDVSQVEQLYVNGKQQILARYPDYDENGGHWQGHAPDAIEPERISKWLHPAGGIVHAMHGSEWGDFHFTIKDTNESGEVELEGGHQNNRPNRMHTRYRMVENIFEELDSPGEFFFDKLASKLYWMPEKSGEPLNATIEIPVLSELVVVKGSIDKFVSNINIRGISFSHSTRTFMEYYEPLLRSDWTIYRGGALFFEGVQACSLTDCELTALGGNGIFLSGFCRKVEIARNHIHNIGASGVLVVGDPDAVRSPSFQYGQYVNIEEMDTINGPKNEAYPAVCLIDNNLIHRVGRIEKQIAGVQLSMCMDITISHNSIYDVPRAGINISEGTWGGHIIEFNDVFMTVQESGDHGSFNSWGRDRFWHPNRGIMDSLNLADPLMPLWDAIHTTIIRNNRFRCDHGWDIDLDDGSTNYELYNNLCLNGGIKLREGFYRTVENNIMINNGFHPHVWFSNSADIFRKNIVMTDHKDIRLAAWGKEVDYNLFPSDAALAKAQKNGTDQNSLVGNPDFIAPEQGDFRVSESSPALKLGFKNFDMDQFGVQHPALKNIRQEPQIPSLFIEAFQKEKQKEIEWLGARIKNIESMAERSASGLSEESGVLILEITSGGLAEQAGLEKGDVILSCENTAVKTMQDLLQSHQGNNWKGRLELRIFRNQTELTKSIKTK